MTIIIKTKETGTLTWEVPEDIAARFTRTSLKHKQLGTKTEALNNMERIIVDDLQNKLLAFLLILRSGLSCQKPSGIMNLIDAKIAQLAIEAMKLAN
jgi:hypothetical protein